MENIHGPEAYCRDCENSSGSLIRSKYFIWYCGFLYIWFFYKQEGEKNRAIYFFHVNC